MAAAGRGRGGAGRGSGRGSGGGGMVVPRTVGSGGAGSGGSGGGGLAAMSGAQIAAVENLFGALQRYGPAPGAKQLLEREKSAAEHAINTSGIYVTWRCASKASDCTRIGPASACFCGHPYSSHIIQMNKNSFACGGGCGCKRYAYLPTRPEEVGEWWLPRRPGFNIHTYAVKCKCTHTASEHDASDRNRKCRACAKCYGWDGNYACVVCDRKDSEHEVVWETAAERTARGAPTGSDYMPFAELPAVADLVFADKSGRTTTVGTRKQFNAAPPQPKSYRGLMPLPSPAQTTGSATASDALDWNDRPVRINHNATSATAAAAFDDSDVPSGSSGSGSGGAAASTQRVVRSKTIGGSKSVNGEKPVVSAAVNHKTGFTPSKQHKTAAAPPSPVAGSGRGKSSAAKPAAKPQPTSKPAAKPTASAAAAASGGAAPGVLRPKPKSTVTGSAKAKVLTAAAKSKPSASAKK